MARLNPRRRRLAAQEKLLREITLEHGKAHDDSYKLQQGRVASSYERIGREPPAHARSIAHRSNSRSDGLAPSWYVDGAKRVYQGDK